MLLTLPLSHGVVEFELGIVTFHLYTFFAVILFPFALWRMVTKPENFGFRGQDLAILLLAFSYLQSTLLSDSLVQSGRLAFHALFIPIVSYVLAKALVTSEKKYKLAFKFLIAGTLYFSLATIYVYVTTRLRPFVFDIPPIGVATLLVIPVIYFIYNKDKWVLTKKGMFGLSLSALILSFSRAYLLLIIITPAIVKFLKSRVMFIWLTMFISTLFMTIIFTYSVADFSAITSKGEGQDTASRVFSLSHIERALVGRAYVYKLALQDFDKNIAFGEGMSVGDTQVTPHNFHVEWLKFGGIFGYLFYALVFLLHAKSIAPHLKNDNYLIINNLILLLIMVNSVTNGFMHGVMPYAAFIIMGLSEARLNFIKRESKKSDDDNKGKSLNDAPVINVKSSILSTKKTSKILR